MDGMGHVWIVCPSSHHFHCFLGEQIIPVWWMFWLPTLWPSHMANRPPCKLIPGYPFPSFTISTGPQKSGFGTSVHQQSVFFFLWITLPKTNIEPANRPFEKESSLPTMHFQMRAVSFREGIVDPTPKNHWTVIRQFWPLRLGPVISNLTLKNPPVGGKWESPPSGKFWVG